eukprot:SAG11_NODE_34368_length_272_cov_0.884393_1_plen_45_part_10
MAIVTLGRVHRSRQASYQLHGKSSDFASGLLDDSILFLSHRGGKA